MSYAATYEDVLAAAARIRGLAHQTPVMTCGALDALAGRKIFLKCENLQKVGAFKFRGASHAVSRLGDEEARRGVVTHSSGNHAQALALAARLRGIPAWIVMPTDAPGVKRRAVEGYGATVVPCAPTLAARESTAAEVVSRTGATLIPPYNHPDIIAGQGTAALELLEEVPGLDVVIAPVGGGGLMSGTCVATRGRSPQTRLFGAEPAGADDAARSLAAGQLLPQTGPKTIADGLRTGLGDLTWPILRDHLEGIVTVSEEEIIAATRLLWERAKLVVEPSGAVPLAALLGSRRGVFGEAKRVGVIVSGGNLDLDQLPWQR
jgi:threonine dehydratase